MDPANIPVLIGVARRTDKSARRAAKDASLLTADLLRDRRPACDLAKTAREAIADASLSPEQVSVVCAVKIAQLPLRPPGAVPAPPLVKPAKGRPEPYPNMAGSVAFQAGIQPKLLVNTHVGGDSPQKVINELARRIARGQNLGVCVVVGGENLAMYRAAQIHKVELPWGFDHEPFDASCPTELWGIDKPGFSEAELAHGLSAPRFAYPMIEMALRHRISANAPLSKHVERCARIMERFNHVAAENKALSWFPERYSWQEIATVSPQNRLVALPYPKRMNSVMDVDQWGAVVLTSLAEARRLNVDPSKYVFLHGFGEAVETGFQYSTRPDLSRCPAMEHALHEALRSAHMTVQDCDAFDIYSCFPVAVELACEALGIDPLTDPRPLTVTGGLPYAGGPGNAYTLLSIAAMVSRIRSGAATTGLVSANGWIVTKHAAGVYSRLMPSHPIPTQYVEYRSTDPVREVCLRPKGQGRIDAYTVEYKSEAPGGRNAIIIGTLVSGPNAGQRFVARSLDDGVTAALLGQGDFVGALVEVAPAPQGSKLQNVFMPLPGKSAL